MISIVIPTYNRAKVITHVLDNLLAQTCPNWQCVVVDDHSTDNTAEVVLQFTSKDARFVYLMNKRKKGAQGARNTGILAAAGEWICFFDSDDVMYPEYIERMQKEIEKNDADVEVCYANIYSSQFNKVLGCLNKIQTDDLHTRLLTQQSYVAYDVCVIRKQKLLDIGLLDESCPSMQEWDTHIRLSKICKYHLIPEVLCDWIVGGDDAITHDAQRHINGRLYIYTKHRREFRRYAYREYLYALYKLWPYLSKHNELIHLAPELLLYVPLKRMLK